MASGGKALFISIAFLFSPVIPCFAEGDGKSKLTPTESETIFLDRLMRAELDGRLFAKNPASSALGPYQFVEATFLDVVRRNLPAMASGKSNADILALRVDPAVSREVALLYTRENANALAAKGVPATPANLRLAFFAGASAALKVLQAKPEEPATNLMSAAAIQANPFLKTMTAAQLIAKAEREIEGGGVVTAAAAASPKISLRCNLKLASCRKWLALAGKRLGLGRARLAEARER